MNDRVTVPNFVLRLQNLLRLRTCGPYIAALLRICVAQELTGVWGWTSSEDGMKSKRWEEHWAFYHDTQRQVERTRRVLPDVRTRFRPKLLKVGHVYLFTDLGRLLLQRGRYAGRKRHARRCRHAPILCGVDEGRCC